MATTAIQVWRFMEAPADLRELSTNGGDEDWLALVPAKFNDDYIGWLGTDFGCFGVETHDLPTGDKVYIGCHS